MDWRAGRRSSCGGVADLGAWEMHDGDGRVWFGSMDDDVVVDDDDDDDDGRRKQELVPSSIRLFSVDPSASVYHHDETLNTI